MNGKTYWKPIIVAVALVLGLAGVGLGVIALNEVGQAGDLQTMGVTNLSSLTLSDNLVVGGNATVTGDLSASGDNMLGYATADKELVCGTTSTFTASTAVDLSSTLTAIDYAVVAQVTAPITTGAFLHFTAPTTTTLAIISLESDYTAGTTGVVAQYCAVGDQ